jgi:hypothetical protein
VALLGRVRRRPVALLADPSAGLRFAKQVVRHRDTFQRHFIPAGSGVFLLDEFNAAAAERTPRLQAYRQTLERLGYQVVGVPDLRVRREKAAFGDTRLDFSYCNVLSGLHAGRPAVHYLPWGIGTLDRAAEECYRAAGVTAVRVSSDPLIADALMQLSAGLHCFCGPLP